MAFTPSNLSLMSLGSGKLTIATVTPGSAASAVDSWASGIHDIQAVIPFETGIATTPSAIACSFTGSSGAVHLIRSTETACTLLVISGFATDMTW